MSEARTAVTAPTPEETAPRGAMDGKRYLESLRDGREVWVHGERVKDVTRHPAFAPVAREMARLYDLQVAPETRDVMTYATEGGLRASYSYLAPRTLDDLLKRRANAELWARETYGMMGRFPDFCAAMIVGMYDVRDELAKLDPRFKSNIEAYYAYARDHDLALSHGLHDPSMDKSLRPEQDPDRCLRVVRERDDGIVVRGARFVTLGPLANEMVIAPTYVLNEREREFALWFALSPATPGVRQICRAPLTLHRNPKDHPVSVRFDEQDALVVFDDVLVPWERVFLAYAPLEANKLFRSRVMAWASYTSALQLLARLDLMMGVAHLMAEQQGITQRPHVLAELGELATYAQIFRSIVRAAEVDGSLTPMGHYALAGTPHLRAFMAMTSERMVSVLEHIGTSSIIFVPSAEDMDVPELRALIDVYGRGKDTDAASRQRLSKLAWELTGDSFGGRQQLYERLHSGSPEAMIANAYNRFDKSRGVAMVRRLLGEEG